MILRKKDFLILGLFATVCGLGGAFIFNKISGPGQNSDLVWEKETSNSGIRTSYSANITSSLDFVKASETGTPAVVFIKTVSAGSQSHQDFFGFWDFFGNRGPVSGSGSGVIISPDGYIVTNYHVIKEADKIEVLVNKSKKTYAGVLVGSDASSDLALIKIEASGLKYLSPANSDELKIGEWVLAVGNPLNLTSTVTAGIVSAKGRNINIVNNQFPIESFIQTDAAINPGNSGGALINLDGKLVGVNTAIKSETGSYVGYGFAIPSNIVMKIVKDLKDFGQIQRAIPGINVIDLDGKTSEKLGNLNSGVYISQVTGECPDSKKMLEVGDVILKMNLVAIEDKAVFDEQMAYQRPGQTVKFTILRNGKTIEKDITLVNKEGTTEMIKKTGLFSESLGAYFEKISKIEKERYGLKSGYRVSDIKSGRVRQMNIGEGFIFTALNGKTFDSLGDFINFFEGLKGQVRIDGISPQGRSTILSFYFY